jgi:hypothetical protein
MGPAARRSARTLGNVFNDERCGRRLSLLGRRIQTRVHNVILGGLNIWLGVVQLGVVRLGVVRLGVLLLVGLCKDGSRKRTTNLEDGGFKKLGKDAATSCLDGQLVRTKSERTSYLPCRRYPEHACVCGQHCVKSGCDARGRF